MTQSITTDDALFDKIAGGVQAILDEALKESGADDLSSCDSVIMWCCFTLTLFLDLKVVLRAFRSFHENYL